jgi:hypothetical protein
MELCPVCPIYETLFSKCLAFEITHATQQPPFQSADIYLVTLPLPLSPPCGIYNTFYQTHFHQWQSAYFTGHYAVRRQLDRQLARRNRVTLAGRSDTAAWEGM